MRRAFGQLFTTSATLVFSLIVFIIVLTSAADNATIEAPQIDDDDLCHAGSDEVRRSQFDETNENVITDSNLL